jgi:hypothetical protein
MYTNIPRKDIINIINNILDNNVEIQSNIRKDIIYILKTMMEQNYFQFDQKYYKQMEGLAMGAPTSAILAETFIQHMEHKYTYPILNTQIFAYYRYVDDILIIYNKKKTNIEETLTDFNNIQPSIKFTIEKEKHRKINYLDITIHRKNNQFEFSIYRKPTQTDIIIPSSSCHLYEHKLSGIRYLVNRLNTFPITDKSKQREKSTISNILQNNECNINLLMQPLPQSRKQNIHREQKHKTKWATFAYCGKEVLQITKLFKDTQLKIAFRTRNTINNILKHHTQTDKYNNSGIYQMKCLDCPLKYIGQTGRAFNIRYKEHIHAIRSNNSNSGYSNHILNTKHTYSTITDTMDVIRIGRKGRHLNTLEKYHIYEISRNNLHMNETHIELHNPIFKTVHEIYNR